jgi:hypothetical protein
MSYDITVTLKGSIWDRLVVCLTLLFYGHVVLNAKFLDNTKLNITTSEIKNEESNVEF